MFDWSVEGGGVPHDDFMHKGLAVSLACRFEPEPEPEDFTFASAFHFHFHILNVDLNSDFGPQTTVRRCQQVSKRESMFNRESRIDQPLTHDQF